MSISPVGRVPTRAAKERPRPEGSGGARSRTLSQGGLNSFDAPILALWSRVASTRKSPAQESGVCRQDQATSDKIVQKQGAVLAYLDCMLANRSPRQSENWETNAGNRWDPADLLFLISAVDRGLSIEEVAGFLQRPANEVQEKARGLVRR
jgi:hypothetical protein